jgi:hypothetical protein
LQSNSFGDKLSPLELIQVPTGGESPLLPCPRFRRRE